MKKSELIQRTNNAVNETRLALQTVYDCLNDGQKKRIVKNNAVKMLFDRYDVNYK